jgi:hypothetical protein
MIGVFFLAVRMRNLQTNPPDGTPPLWVKISYYTVIVGLILEMCASACCPGSSTECGEQDVPADYDPDPDNMHYSPSKWVRRAQQVTALLVFGGLGSVFSSVIYSISEGGALSSAMKAVMMLSVLFFGVHIMQWVASFFTGGGKSSHVVQGTALSAGVCVSLCPLLSILYVACRMRALQLTEQKGSPQWWAQESMHLGVIAILIQVTCCVLLPLFTGAATAVDPDGNAEYDLRPLFGAYVVQMLKYMALFLLYGSVLAVCASIGLMRKDMKEGVYDAGQIVGTHMLIGILTLAMAGILSSAKVVGFVVKWAIEELDERFLGVNIRIAKAALSLCRGYIFVSDLVVDNPIGPRFASEALLKIGKVVVKINLWRFLTSKGKTIEINTLVLSGVQVNYEKDLFGQSNVGMVVKYLSGPEDQEAETSTPQHLATKAEDATKPKKPSEDQSDGMQVQIHQLRVQDVAANIFTTQTGRLGSINIWDIDDEHFQERFKDGKMPIGSILAEILKTILKTVLQNSSRLTGGAASLAHSAAERSIRTTGSLFRRLGQCLPCGGERRRRELHRAEAESAQAEAVLRAAT